MTNARNYSCRDVDMLMTSKTIAESFRVNINELAAIRNNWSEQYAGDIIARIDNAIAGSLGIYTRESLTEATTTLLAIMNPAIRDVSFLKSQITEDFHSDKDRRDKILKKLGFGEKTAFNRLQNQETLMKLLYSIKSNLTDALRKELAAKGITDELLDRIASYADTFKHANAVQESFKKTTQHLTRELNEQFNGIYREIIAICKYASHYYRQDPLMKQQFTFSSVLEGLGRGKRTTVEAMAPASA